MLNVNYGILNVQSNANKQFSYESLVWFYFYFDWYS